MCNILLMPVPDAIAVSSRTLLRDSVYRHLCEAIIDGTFTPGEQLRENELQDWLGVSRTPIREALMRLQRAGLVVTLPGRSTIVSELDAQRVRDAQSVVAAMHELAVRTAVPLMRAEHLEEMRAANQAFADALDRGDVVAALAADDALHAVPVRVAANTVVVTVLDEFSPLLRRVERLLFSSAAGAGSIALHDVLLEQCRRGDVDGAAMTARSTWQALATGSTSATGGTVSAGHGFLRPA